MLPAPHQQRHSHVTSTVHDPCVAPPKRVLIEELDRSWRRRYAADRLVLGSHVGMMFAQHHM